MITFALSLEDGEYVVRADGFAEVRFSSFNDLLKDFTPQLAGALGEGDDFEVIWTDDDDE